MNCAQSSSPDNSSMPSGAAYKAFATLGSNTPGRLTAMLRPVNSVVAAHGSRRRLANAAPLPRPRGPTRIVPGEPGQEALMDDEETLSFIRQQVAKARYVFSVCTGALILGAAGLLK